MPSLGFQERWVPDILSGRKQQTIRWRRDPKKPRYKVGDTLYLFIGMRTKSCQRLGEAECMGVRPFFRTGPFTWYTLTDEKLRICELQELARADGFENVDDFEDWFSQYPDGAILDCIIWGDSFRLPAPQSEAKRGQRKEPARD